MKICIATSSFPINRNEVYHHFLKELIDILNQKGHEVTILTQDKKGDKEIIFPNADVVWFPWKMTEQRVLAQVSLKSFSNIFSIISLFINGVKYSNRIAKEKKIDVFICLWIVPSGLYIFLKNVFFKKTPYMLWSLGSDVYTNKDNFIRRLILKLIIRKSKAVFADGFELCDIINKISGRQCDFLPTFQRIKIPETTIISNDNVKKQTTFLYVGRLAPVKGTDILIDAIKLIKKEHGNMNFRCNIIGDGDLMNDLIREIKENDLGENVFLLGWIKDENILAEYYKQADCVIIPSRSESIPIVLSEAMQFGKPMITSTAGDMAFLVKKYNLGIVVEKENAADLATAIKTFIELPTTVYKDDQDKLMANLIFENNNQKLLRELK